MDENYVSKDAYNEFVARMKTENDRLADEDRRQNKRIEKLEENVEAIHNLTVSMERMSANMQSMLEAIERQGKLIEKQTSRIDTMEKEPADNYKKIKMAIITTAIGVFVGAVAGVIITLL